MDTQLSRLVAEGLAEGLAEGRLSGRSRGRSENVLLPFPPGWRTSWSTASGMLQEHGWSGGPAGPAGRGSPPRRARTVVPGHPDDLSPGKVDYLMIHGFCGPTYYCHCSSFEEWLEENLDMLRTIQLASQDCLDCSKEWQGWHCNTCRRIVGESLAALDRVLPVGLDSCPFVWSSAVRSHGWARKFVKKCRRYWENLMAEAYCTDVLNFFVTEIRMDSQCVEPNLACWGKGVERRSAPNSNIAVTYVPSGNQTWQRLNPFQWTQKDEDIDPINVGFSSKPYDWWLPSSRSWRIWTTNTWPSRRNTRKPCRCPEKVGRSAIGCCPIVSLVGS